MSILMPREKNYKERLVYWPRGEESIEQKLLGMGDAERREKVLTILMMFGGDLWDELERLRAEKRKKMLEDLAAEGDGPAAEEWWELYGERMKVEG